MKNPKSSIDIADVAKLANLKLTPSEEKTFTKQLGEILTYVESLDKLNTDKVEPIAHITGQTNIVREDEAAPSLSQDDALSNAKNKRNGFFEVPGILENE